MLSCKAPKREETARKDKRGGGGSLDGFDRKGCALLGQGDAVGLAGQ